VFCQHRQVTNTLILTSLRGGTVQQPHYDCIPSTNLPVVPFINEKATYSFILSLMPDTTIMLYNKTNTHEYEGKQIRMMENELLIFRTNDQIHAGDKYTKTNVRLFGNIIPKKNPPNLDKVHFEKNMNKITIISNSSRTNTSNSTKHPRLMK